MKFVMYQDCLSPHQLPLAREIVRRVGVDNFRYVYTDDDLDERKDLGWNNNVREPWAIHVGTDPELAHELIENADALLMMFRDVGLIERRCAKGLKTFYDSERWFKPILIKLPIPLSTSTSHLHLSLPGWLKLLSPSYFKMAWQIARLLNTQPNFHYLPIGPHAARDMRLLCRLCNFFTFHFSLFTPEFIPWGYFVAPSTLPPPPPRTSTSTHALRVLWVGRMLNWKRVDTVIRAVAYANRDLAKLRSTPTPSTYTSITLTLVGDGPEKPRLQRFANKLEKNYVRHSSFITHHSSFDFLPPVPIGEVRSIMRQHDVYVISSNAFEGWGAVVSEALSEGMRVVGTYEAGSSATLLAKGYLFHAGDWRTLSRMLCGLDFCPQALPEAYAPSGAVERIWNFV